MNREEYLERMAGCRQFSYFGITPMWRPGEQDVEGFCHDEVIRQGHDPRVRDDGGCRVEWMQQAWRYAENRAFYDLPDVTDIQKVGALVEQKYNVPGSGWIGVSGFRTDDVYIGGRKGANPWRIAEMVAALATRVPFLKPGPANIDGLFKYYSDVTFVDRVAETVFTVDAWYLAYEWIHPWPDGNGRSGKVLHNWLGRTLHEPVLVLDYFKGGNP